MNSDDQNLRTVSVSSSTALIHSLESTFIEYENPQLVESLKQSLLKISTELLALLGDIDVDILSPKSSGSSNSISMIFYGLHHNDHFYQINLPNFQRYLASIEDLWTQVAFYQLPLQNLTLNSSKASHMSALTLEMHVSPHSIPAKLRRSLQVSAFTRAYPGLTDNGDGYWYKYDDDCLFLCIVDGLGHGTEAQRARREAINSVKKNYPDSLHNIFSAAHHALRDTRGVAMTIARIFLNENKVESAGIGNVDLKLYPQESFFVPKGGVLGMGRISLPKVAVSNWMSDSLLILYSDGISGQWTLKPLVGENRYSARFLSHFLVRNFARQSDDSTALVVCGN